MAMYPDVGHYLLFDFITVLFICFGVTCLEIPLEIEQPPVITQQSPASQIAFSFDDNVPIQCEAKGTPAPQFKWTKNGLNYDFTDDPRITRVENSGTFIIHNNGNITEFQGKYRCYASNKLGTAISEEIEFLVPSIPKFPHEIIKPITVQEGNSVVLKCNPPKGIPPLEIYWMTIGLQHIEQSSRVSVGLNGDLYFSNVVGQDSRRDYCCYAAFPRIRTIVQKTPMTLIVKRTNTDASVRPSLMTPTGVHSNISAMKGETVKFECIAEGLPTPEIEWTKVNGDLPQGRTKKENFGKLLIISKVTEKDDGKYKCTAANDLGNVEHYFYLTVEEPPKWSYKPESTIYSIGSEVRLKCEAGGKPRPTIEWKVNGRPLNEAQKRNLVLTDNKIIIANAHPDDSAVYQCEAVNKYGTILANAVILVKNVAPLILTNLDQNYTAVEGQKVFIQCEVFGSPRPDVDWLKDDQLISTSDPRYFKHENGSLEIINVIKEDSGLYTCWAKNTEGEAAMTGTLAITDATKITQSPEDVAVPRGSSAELMCQIKTDSAFIYDMHISWRHNNKEIFFNYTNGSRFFLDDSTLQIVNVSVEDQGLYTCVARSPLDEASATAKLTVLDVPDPPTDLEVSAANSSSVTLRWTPQDSHNSPITEYIIEYEEDRWNPNKWFQLLRVSGNDSSVAVRMNGHLEYQFRVSAVNKIGRSESSKPSKRYRTPPTAPFKNPENIKTEALSPNEMIVKWELLSPLEYNGPGLEYKVSWRRRGTEENWNEQIVKNYPFFIKNTPTFVPYEIKVQAINQYGGAPQPEAIVGYSAEDFPVVAPKNVSVEILNSTLIKVHWSRIPQDKVNGILRGYQINWWRLRNLLEEKKSHGEKYTLTFSGDRDHGLVPGLKPFSEYTLTVMAFNGKGNGPGSSSVTFKTPEGAPEQPALLKVASFNKDSITLLWAPPNEPNGLLTGYLLKYQLINNTDELGSLQVVNISKPSITKWKVQDLEVSSRYKFYLSACTKSECGKTVTEEGITIMDGAYAGMYGGVSNQGWFIGLMCAMALLTLIMLIACFIQRNKGGKYSVKEKEDLNPDKESRQINEDMFCDYSECEESPLKGFPPLLNEEMKADDSGDSLADYGDEEHSQFNEDGSFIGEYTGQKERRPAEVNGSVKGAN
ncbi:neural cell adhesion molecule L1-like protein [Polypterus senegalus]